MTASFQIPDEGVMSRCSLSGCPTTPVTLSSSSAGPGITALERALAASVLAEAIKSRVAVGHVGDDWLARVSAEIQRLVPDLVEPDKPAADQVNE